MKKFSKENFWRENRVWSTRKEQVINRRKPSNNKSGKTGVFEKKPHKDGTRVYQAYIRVDGKHITLITTTDYELAVFCREEGEIHYFGRNTD